MHKHTHTPYTRMHVYIVTMIYNTVWKPLIIWFVLIIYLSLQLFDQRGYVHTKMLEGSLGNVYMFITECAIFLRRHTLSFHINILFFWFISVFFWSSVRKMLTWFMGENCFHRWLKDVPCLIRSIHSFFLSRTQIYTLQTKYSVEWRSTKCFFYVFSTYPCGTPMFPTQIRPKIQTIRFEFLCLFHSMYYVVLRSVR